jgi:hypothetical protein
MPQIAFLYYDQMTAVDTVEPGRREHDAGFLR